MTQQISCGMDKFYISGLLILIINLIIDWHGVVNMDPILNNAKCNLVMLWLVNILEIQLTTCFVDNITHWGYLFFAELISDISRYVWSLWCSFNICFSVQLFSAAGVNEPNTAEWLCNLCSRMAGVFDIDLETEDVSDTDVCIPDHKPQIITW